MDYMKEWFEDSQKRIGITWKKAVTVEGTCNSHVGPSIRYASITLEFSPNDQFFISDELSEDICQQAKEQKWYQSIIFGILDVILTMADSPIRNVKVRITNIEFNDIESTPIAFRLAARDAARKALFDQFPNHAPAAKR